MKKKLMISLVLVSSIALGTSACAMISGKAAAGSTVQTVPVQKGDLVNSVLASGIVESASASAIYSKVQNLALSEVLAAVGDPVKAGDVLATLDTSSLELDILQTKLNIENAEAGLAAENESNRFNRTSAANNLESARLDRNERRDDYETVKEAHDEGNSTDAKLAQAKNARDKAQLAYDNAKANLEFIESKNTQAADNNIQIQQAALEKLQKNLADAQITAPQDGIVTLVNAKVGSPASGLLFVVEDPNGLIISTAIGEYDIQSVRIGQSVVVKADGTANRDYPGTISTIAPTSVKDNEGNSAASSNVQFATEVALAEHDEAIRIGMNVQLTIKLEEKKATFFIPYDALTTESDGTYSIQVVDAAQSDAKEPITRKITVQKGMETDMYIEIFSPELTEGLSVQTNPAAAAE